MERTRDQRQALEHANRVRVRRAEARRSIGRAPFQTGCVWVVALLRGQPDWAVRWRVADVLGCLPGFGRVKVDRLMRDVGIGAARTVGGLTERQRSGIEAELRVALSTRQASSCRRRVAA